MNYLDPVLNGVEVEVSTGYDSSATSVVLASGEGSKLPDPSTDGNFNLVWYNASDYRRPFDDPNVEIIRVTAKSTDTLTVTRPASGNSYNGEGSVNVAATHNISGKTYKMMLAFTKSQVDKIDNNMPTTAEKAVWDGKPTADEMLAVRRLAIENALGILEIQAADTLTSGVAANMIRDIFSDATGYLNTINTSNTTAGFSTNKYQNTVTSNVTEGHGVTFDSTISDVGSFGIKITPSVAISLVSVTKSATSTATRCRIWADNSGAYGTLLGTATFSSNVATFSSPISLTSGTKYIIEADNSGSSHTVHRKSAFSSYPITETDFAWNSGSSDGSTITSNVYEVLSITYTKATIGNYTIVTNSQSLSFTPTHFQVFAYKKNTSGTGGITADVSFNGGTNYQTGIVLDTPTEITNQGTSLVLKINLNAGASSGAAECQGYGIMFWEE